MILQVLVEVFQWPNLGWLLAGAVVGGFMGTVVGSSAAFILFIVTFTPFTAKIAPLPYLMVGAVLTCAAVRFAMPLRAVRASDSLLPNSTRFPKTLEWTFLSASEAYAIGFLALYLGGFVGIVAALPTAAKIQMGSSELFLMTVLGVAVVGYLDRAAPLRAWAMAGTGVLIAFVGSDPQTGTLRWTMDTLYLWDGMPLFTAAYGLLILPEVITFFSRLAKPAGLAGIAGGGHDTGVADAGDVDIEINRRRRPLIRALV
ncbi:MAG: tripartite tricarboxylate transporter permease, partial [Alphaproteobacteria bacterium]|nr:tripartite tricarboxylate transporter permease [Alphaproteobacteria bacterium]